ncbi:MAG: VOC family protein [Nitrospinae bacterium]|nr:VOC family protein [Nitrospinota bacterium]
MKPIYFDFTVNSLKEARRFFERVLGWRFEKFPMPYEYYRITAGNSDEPGIDGGSVVEQKMVIPGIGWYATCAEPGGLKFGLLQVDQNAK